MNKKTFHITQEFETKSRVWSQKYTYAVFLNSFNSAYPQGSFSNKIAVTSISDHLILGKDDIRKGKEYYGFICYDYKNQIENLTSQNTARSFFPDFFFFEPEITLEFTDETIIITSADPTAVFEHINTIDIYHKEHKHPIHLKAQTSKNEYVNNVNDIISHIHKGDIYEINYCINFLAENVETNPLAIYENLCRLSPTPFASFVKYEDQYLMCASPERYFKLENDKIISQPIKGTVRLQNTDDPKREIIAFHESAKERNENVMIVDLVRNDLSKVCKAGTVKVDELYGVYQFTNLLQMISTVSGVVEKDKYWLDIVEATFPMGSMTGAPKFRSLQLIEKYENFKRNIYSGTVGAIDESGNADFNVVIRSIFYDAKSRTISFAVGGGITALSDAEKEYDECMLKAENILKVLQLNHNLIF